MIKKAYFLSTYFSRNMQSVFLRIVFMYSIFILNTHTSFSQCTGKLEAPVIIKTFGSGTSLYNNDPISKFGFSNTFLPRDLTKGIKTNDGHYSIVNKVPDDFGVWHTVNVDDHTPNDINGYMLLVNGDDTKGEFYRDTAVGLCKGSTYEFSAYLANVFKSTSPKSNPPKASFEIRDLAGNLIKGISTNDIPISANFTWIKYGITFQAPASSIVLVMISTAPPGRGNDIAIDDIAFSPCSPLAAITKFISVCENSNATIPVLVTGNADFRFSQWQKSKDNGLTWNDTGNVITQSNGASSYTLNLNLQNVPIKEDSTLYRLKLSTDPAYLSGTNSACNAISDTSMLVVNPLKTLKIASQAALCKDSASFISTANTQNIFTLSWQKSSTNAVLQDNSSKTFLVNPNISDLANDSIWVIATSTDNVSAMGSCPNIKDSIKVKFYEPPIILAPNDTAFCLVLKEVILPLKANLKYSNDIKWSTSSTLAMPIPSNGPTTSLSISGAIDEKIYITAIAKGCRSVKDSVLIKTNILDTIRITAPRLVCITNPIINASFQSSSVFGNKWQGNISQFSPTITSKTISYSPNSVEITSRSVFLKASTLALPNQLCPVVSDSVTVQIASEPILTLPSDTTLCFSNKPINFPVSAIVSNADSLIWSTNSTIEPFPKNSNNTNLSITNNTSFNVSGTAYKNGCAPIPRFMTIKFEDAPNINIPILYKHCFESDPPITLSSNPFMKYEWKSENAILDTTQSIQVNPEKDTYYFLKVRNKSICKDSTKVLVRKVCPPRLFVPNVMTPESQDVNAGLRIYGSNYTNFEISVFNRWGEVIFNSKDPNNAWNGEYLNNKMPIGNYQWQVSYEGDTEEYKGPYKKTGDVTIVR